MTQKALRVLIVSDANMANLSAVLRADSSEPEVSVSEAPFGAVIPTLLDPASSVWSESPDLTVVWTQPETGRARDSMSLVSGASAATCQVATFAPPVEPPVVVPPARVRSGAAVGLPFAVPSADEQKKRDVDIAVAVGVWLVFME